MLGATFLLALREIRRHILRSILTTLGIILSLLFESLRFFEKVHPLDFVFGLEWSPQTAIRKDQVGATGLFGAIPLLAGTMLISLIAMCVAAPVGLMAAIYMSEYAPSKVRGTVKPMLEILAGIPTVVYGFFAALTVAPFFRDWGLDLGLTISSESALAERQQKAWLEVIFTMDELAFLCS